MCTVLVKYVNDAFKVDVYNVNSKKDILTDGLLVQVKDTRGGLHTLYKDVIEYIRIYGKDDVNTVFNNLEDNTINKYLCNYGGTDSAIVYAISEDSALDKYVKSIKDIYRGVKKDECNCELYSTVKVIK